MRSRAMRSTSRPMNYPHPTALPAGFPRTIRADGKSWLWTGKIGTDIATGQPSAEYGTDAIRYWRRQDGTVTRD